MINTYQYYSHTLQSLVTISYYDGMLKAVDIETVNTERQANETTNFVTKESNFLEHAKARNIKITKTDRVITFEMFWDKYDYKASGKKEAQTSWSKLSQRDQQGAYDWITPYFSQIKLENKPKLHASSYLNKQRWIK